MKFLFVNCLLISRSCLRRLRTKFSAPQEKNEIDNLDTRIELVSPYFDVGYWSRCHQNNAGASGEPVVDFVSRGFSKDSNPHPLFDSGYYLAQLPGVQSLDITLLEHYVLPLTEN